MKFWQLISIFRDEEHILLSTLPDPLLQQFKDRDLLIQSQQRDILDINIDHFLLELISLASSKKLFLSKDRRKIFSYRTDSGDQEIRISEAVNLFDHDTIEEAFEKTEADPR